MSFANTVFKQVLSLYSNDVFERSQRQLSSGETCKVQRSNPSLICIVHDQYWCSTWCWCYKTFFGGNLDFPKIKKLNKVGSDDWTYTKMLKQCYLKLNYIKTLLICSKMAYSCCFSLGGNLDFIDFLQKKFYNINYRELFRWRSWEKRLAQLSNNFELICNSFLLFYKHNSLPLAAYLEEEKWICQQNHYSRLYLTRWVDLVAKLALLHTQNNLILGIGCSTVVRYPDLCSSNLDNGNYLVNNSLFNVLKRKIKIKEAVNVELLYSF